MDKQTTAYSYNEISLKNKEEQTTDTTIWMTLKNMLNGRSFEQEEYIGGKLEQGFLCPRERGGRNDWEEHIQVMGTF